MNLTATVGTELIEADPKALALADAVIDTLNLPSDGIPVHDPATGQFIAHVPNLGSDDALHARARRWAHRACL